MGRWFVSGALEQTGEELSRTFEADSEAAAALQARQAGILVAEVKPAPPIPLDYKSPAPRPQPKLPLEPTEGLLRGGFNALLDGIYGLVMAIAAIFCSIMVIYGLSAMAADSDLRAIRGLLSILVGILGFIFIKPGLNGLRGRHAK